MSGWSVVWDANRNPNPSLDGEITVSQRALAKAGMTAEEAEAIYRLTSLPTYQERFVVPPYSREGDIEEVYDPQQRKAETGFRKRQSPHRGL